MSTKSLIPNHRKLHIKTHIFFTLTLIFQKEEKKIIIKTLNFLFFMWLSLSCSQIPSPSFCCSLAHTHKRSKFQIRLDEFDKPIKIGDFTIDLERKKCICDSWIVYAHSYNNPNSMQCPLRIVEHNTFTHTHQHTLHLPSWTLVLDTMPTRRTEKSKCSFSSVFLLRFFGFSNLSRSYLARTWAACGNVDIDCINIGSTIAQA